MADIGEQRLVRADSESRHMSLSSSHNLGASYLDTGVPSARYPGKGLKSEDGNRERNYRWFARDKLQMGFCGKL
jgi:hypothetical protein